MKQGPVARDRVGSSSAIWPRADAEEAVRQTILEKKSAGERLDAVALEIADRARRILAVVDFGSDLTPGPANPTRQ